MARIVTRRRTFGSSENPYRLTIKERGHSWSGRAPVRSSHQTEAEAVDALRAYVRRNWSAELDGPIPADPDLAVDEYFDSVDEAYSIRGRNPVTDLREVTVQPRDKWSLAYEAHLRRFGSPEAAREWADQAVRRNPFTESLVGGIGTGTGLAIAAGVAGPAIVRRLKGAARKTGLLSNPEAIDWYEGGYSVGQQDRQAADAGLYIDPMVEMGRRFEYMNSVAEQYHGYRPSQRSKRRNLFEKGYLRAYGRSARHPKSQRRRTA